MPVTLDELNVAELRALCRQHNLPETYDSDDMRHRLRDRDTTPANNASNSPIQRSFFA